MSILVITTGGTIGAEPSYTDLANPPAIQVMPPIWKNIIRETLQEHFSDMQGRVVTMEPRDSKFIDEKYRQEIVSTIARMPETSVLITHGTDTILQSAEYLDQQIKMNPAMKDKSILLTGSMVPLAIGPEGYINLKFSLTYLSAEPKPGVAIVLSDFQDLEAKTGWKPRLYRIEDGPYEKFYDPEDGSRSRLVKSRK